MKIQEIENKLLGDVNYGNFCLTVTNETNLTCSDNALQSPLKLWKEMNTTLEDLTQEEII